MNIWYSWYLVVGTYPSIGTFLFRTNNSMSSFFFQDWASYLYLFIIVIAFYSNGCEITTECFTDWPIIWRAWWNDYVCFNNMDACFFFIKYFYSRVVLGLFSRILCYVIFGLEFAFALRSSIYIIFNISF